MAFWGKSFIFDNIPSENYGLFLISNGASGVLQNVGSCSVDIFSQQVFRKPKPYFFGTQITPVLKFELSFASLTPLDALQQQQIQKWLFGHSGHKKLQIRQCDLEFVYFNCILTDPKFNTYGNHPYSMTCTVVCDAPWAWEYEKVAMHRNLKGENTTIINNTSDDNYYLIPKVEFKLDNITSQVSIQNLTDNSGFTFENLYPSETITMDGELGIITSSSGELRFDNFKGNFLRLLPKVNTMRVNGGLEFLKITYKLARKVSG